MIASDMVIAASGIWLFVVGIMTLLLLVAVLVRLGKLNHGVATMRRENIRRYDEWRKVEREHYNGVTQRLNNLEDHSLTRSGGGNGD